MPDRWAHDLPRYDAGDLVGTVRILLEYGADLKWRLCGERSVFEYARSYPDISFSRLMETHTLKSSRRGLPRDHRAGLAAGSGELDLGGS